MLKNIRDSVDRLEEEDDDEEEEEEKKFDLKQLPNAKETMEERKKRHEIELGQDSLKFSSKPKLSRNEQKKKKKKDSQKKKIIEEDLNADSSVIYLGRIPHGFYESQMRGYFSQFGDVQNLRLVRNKKGKSKGYAFVQFEEVEIAKIVAETMHNYMMFGHKLVCKVIPKSKVFTKMWRNPRPVPLQENAIREKNRSKTSKELERSRTRLLHNESKKRKMLEGLGIDYDFPGYSSSVRPSAKKKTFSDEEELE
eukprot:TRINITY_DN2768_c0_g1_i2.p1 TRINITY_DN2768_c0_g1~~TRINITY_DN2768_c0_g1_i2.p1  ORF type:complete len:252 (+),score=93.66 TRINITY_DN2768_c0_g1_i2:346-1101(+)